ncbi:MAG: helix-turn-helix domain-containing protein, partial [Christensenellaceae bacterium]
GALMDKERNIALIVGENLKSARKAKGITQAQLAKELKKYQSDYSEYETGKIQLDYEKIVYLCHRLDITPNDLFDFE